MTVATAPARTRPKPRVWNCLFCKSGLHKSCPGMLLAQVGADQGGRPKYEQWFCQCGKDHRTPYCHACKNERVDEVNPETWSCIDTDVCYGRQELRKRNDPIYQMILRCKADAAVERKRKRLMDELAAVGVDPDVDAALEEIEDLIEQKRKTEKKIKPPKAPPRPTSGTCECGCKGKTRGGKFQPGHDAKLASALKNQVRNGDRAAYEEMVRRGWLKKLPAALRDQMEGK